jgi:RNA polymerase sigma-70 factor (ECF subfamily)
LSAATLDWRGASEWLKRSTGRLMLWPGTATLRVSVRQSNEFIVHLRVRDRLNRQAMELELNQIVEAARRGDKPAAIQLIELTYARVYTLLRRLTENEADAADLTQRTFSRVWQALPKFAGRSSVNSWIHSIAYHVYIDWRRADHRTESRPSEWWSALPAGAATPAEETARTDMAARVHAAVAGLEPDLRDSVQLHYYQDLTLQETADAMDVASSTVKYRLRQALAELQKQLQEEPVAPNVAPPIPKVV